MFTKAQNPEYDLVVAGHTVHVLDYGDWQAIYGPRQRPSDWLGDVYRSVVPDHWIAWRKDIRREVFCGSQTAAIDILLRTRAC